LAHDQLLALAPLAENTCTRWPESEKIREVISPADAFDEGRSARHEIDHMVPMVRDTLDEEPTDVNDPAAARKAFRPLTPQHNLAKSRASASCVKNAVSHLMSNNVPALVL